MVAEPTSKRTKSIIKDELNLAKDSVRNAKEKVRELKEKYKDRKTSLNDQLKENTEESRKNTSALKETKRTQTNIQKRIDKEFAGPRAEIKKTQEQLDDALTDLDISRNDLKEAEALVAVSYTHLTLPTIYSV